MIRGSVLGVLLASACSDKQTGEGDARLSYSDDVEPIFVACIACHSPQGNTADGAELTAQGGLDLTGDPLAAMIEVPSGQAVEMMLVEPGDHLYSYLWHKVNGSQSIAGGSGTSMPLGGALTEAEIQTIADWIDDGARP